MTSLNRASLLKKEELKKEKVEIGKDRFVFVREMTARERDRFEKSILKPVKDKKGKTIDYESELENFRAKLAVNTICDEEGKNILKQDDVETLSDAMGAKTMEKIIEVAQRLNKITDKDKEELIKN